jgi:hypothetical protein
MPTYVENYGFTKTLIKDKNHKIKHETKWIGDYNGKVANIQYDVNDNGTKESFVMKLDNDDLKQLLGIQPVQIPLEQRLSDDFLGSQFNYEPIVLESALIKRRTRRHHKSKRRSSKTKRRTSKK